ncbi:AraC family transcriptional regulator [Pseudomonas sp. CGJS7]|uniref:AraC family transcriptional regulator n=1 Tax=Pseudomonas sp. CGJS7 TaxID=3109348 RepID=UPI0030081E72
MPESIRYLPTAITGVDAMSAATARAYPRHVHDQYGIGVVDAGGHASASDRRQVEAGPGQLIFVNPGEVHDGRAIGGRPRAWRMLYLDPALVERARLDIDEGAGRPLVFAAAVFGDVRVRGLLETAFASVTAADAPMACETALLRLLAGAGVNAAEPRRAGTDAAVSVRRARERIDAEPGAELSLLDLAGEVGVSRYQLIRGFARELGLTPHAYIVQRRIALARRLIRAGQGAAEAAAQAGFYDQSHLNRCFVRQFGVTPLRYAQGAR